VGDFSKGAPPRLYAKVLDFGLSSFRAGEGEQNLTKTGVIMGTPSYMAPEQARGKRVDHRADVYGLGTILYTVLTGRAPYDEDSPQSTILALLNSEPPRPRSLVPSIPPHLELIIERAMAKNPDDRFPDMLAFEQALDALPAAKALTQTVPREALAAPTPQPQAIRRQIASDADVHAARPRLLLSLSSAVALLVAGATVAISGLELAIGYSFGKVELRLILLAIVGTSLTPTLLWFLYIRRKIWDSSSRVLSLLSQVRAAVLAGIVSYGLLVLLAHVVDDFLVRFVSRRALQPLGVSWAGWNLLLPAIALVSGVTVGWRQRLFATVQPGWRRLVAAWLGVTLATAIGAGLIYFGILWRAATSR